MVKESLVAGLYHRSPFLSYMVSGTCRSISVSKRSVRLRSSQRLRRVCDSLRISGSPNGGVDATTSVICIALAGTTTARKTQGCRVEQASQQVYAMQLFYETAAAEMWHMTCV